MASPVSPSGTPCLDPKTPAISTGTATAIQHDKAALQDARHRTVWDESMKEVGRGPWHAHCKASVLMFAWDEEWDELGTAQEVEELSDVFEKLFKYKVLIRKIKKNDSLPQHQVAKELTAFVCEHDREGSLLIIYYAGHGMTTTPGTLILHGQQQNGKDEIMNRNFILWHKVEGNLEHTRADVLTIFDCCFAGNLVIPSERSNTPRIFEFLAATGKDTTTPKPGPNSFTKALIWALNKLGQRKVPFSTSELLLQIGNEAPEFPRGRQIPIRKERFEPSDRRLMLAPISENISHTVQPPVQMLDILKEFIDLRFFFDRPPDDNDIKCLAKELKKLTDSKAIFATRIGWVGISSGNIVRVAAMKWITTVRERRSNSALNIPLVDSPQNMNGTSPTSTSSRGRDIPTNARVVTTAATGGTWYHLERLLFCLTADIVKSSRAS